MMPSSSPVQQRSHDPRVRRSSTRSGIRTSYSETDPCEPANFTVTDLVAASPTAAVAKARDAGWEARASCKLEASDVPASVAVKRAPTSVSRSSTASRQRASTASQSKVGNVLLARAGARLVHSSGLGP